LEESVERKDFEMAGRIQKAWKKWRLAKTALEQRAKAANLLRGHKERQRDSLNRTFVGDYMRYDSNFALQEAIRNNGGSKCLVATIVSNTLYRTRRCCFCRPSPQAESS
jgi:hypothetical protein